MPDAPRRRRAIWATIAALVVVLAAGGVGVHFATLSPGDPAAVATRFWNLLAEGKAHEALALSTTSNVPNGLLLTDAVYSKADHVSGVRAGSFTQTGGEASGTISYTLDGKPQTAPVTLTVERAGFFTQPSWRITDAPLGTIQATLDDNGNADSLSVDGTALALPRRAGTVAIPALPGRYTLALGDSKGLFSPVPQTVSVTGGATAATAVMLKLTPAAKLGQQAVAEATSMLNGCFTKPSLDSSCALATGIRDIFDLIAEQTVSYQLTQPPSFAFDTKTMQVVSTSDATITATGTDSKYGSFQNTAQVSFALDVTVTGGKLTLTPHDGGVSNNNYVNWAA